jgi:hypothetical protein
VSAARSSANAPCSAGGRDTKVVAMIAWQFQHDSEGGSS